MVLICQHMDAISSWVDTSPRNPSWQFGGVAFRQSLIWVGFSGIFMTERPHFQVGQWCFFFANGTCLKKNPSTCDPFQPPNLTSKTGHPNIGMSLIKPPGWCPIDGSYGSDSPWWLVDGKKIRLLRFARLVIFHKPSSPRIPQESLNQDTQPEKGPMKVEAGCHELQQLSKCYLGERAGMV